ncbi:hypothetical protein CKO44_16175 [Rubrivivax gelatinosus]|uniref:putative Ig domain-containing protein n=1 Tax=Rubrivivax gelatinosus TaxID=28068 RepID=UPI001904B211|nr:hypothetical protein [Rubrivivax gelatinosus]
MLAAITAAGLGACGGGDEPGADGAQATAAAASGAQPDAAPATAQVRPLFHTLPVLLPEPPRIASSAGQVSAMAAAGPFHVVVDAIDARIDTTRLRPDQFQARRAEARAAFAAGGVRAMDTTVATVYRPDEIRQAYRLPSLETADAAAQGAGQTIYVIVAGHHPTALADLNTFSSRFGLPGCSGSSVASSTWLPLSTASTASGCSLLVANVDATGQLTDQAPPADRDWGDWGVETALDLQWAHAMAPKARLVLIQVPSVNIGDMMQAITLANRMGSGVVSMSWGTDEGSWGPSYRSTFGGGDMIYVAATGDWGTQSMWPAASPEVLAVGGTTLSYDGVNPRQENVWSKSGGAASTYFSRPAYQIALKAQGTPLSTRGTADVSYNADPYTGHFVYHDGEWMSLGGTSAGAPQWAGILAVANAQRRQRGLSTVWQAHLSFYPLMGSRAFSDITSGANGDCAGCTAGVGYDFPTGIGTPNVDVLIEQIAPVDHTPPNRAPVFGNLAVPGRAKSALSFKVPVSDPDGDSITLTVGSGMPKGMSYDTSSRTFSWPKPKAGSYSLALKAVDSKGKSSSGTVVFTIGPANRAPSLPGGSWSAVAGQSFQITVGGSDADGDTLSYTLTQAPAGMSISSAGVVTWPSPTVGKFSVVVKASDAYGASATKKMSLKVVAPPVAPVVDSAAPLATAGKKWSFKVSARDQNGDSLRYAVSGAPAGVAIDARKGKLSWSKPVAGVYVFTVSASDPGGLTGSATVTLTVR